MGIEKEAFLWKVLQNSLFFVCHLIFHLFFSCFVFGWTGWEVWWQFIHFQVVLIFILFFPTVYVLNFSGKDRKWQLNTGLIIYYLLTPFITAIRLGPRASFFSGFGFQLLYLYSNVLDPKRKKLFAIVLVIAALGFIQVTFLPINIPSWVWDLTDDELRDLGNYWESFYMCAVIMAKLFTIGPSMYDNLLKMVGRKVNSLERIKERSRNVVERLTHLVNTKNTLMGDALKQLWKKLWGEGENEIPEDWKKMERCLDILKDEMANIPLEKLFEDVPDDLVTRVPKKEPVNVVNLLTSVYEFEKEFRLKDKDVEVIFDFHESLFVDPVHDDDDDDDDNVSGEREHLSFLLERNIFKKIFTGLFSNACKYTNKGSIEVVCVYDEKDERLYVGVSDTGIGIPEEEQPKIFQPFPDLDLATEDNKEGMEKRRTDNYKSQQLKKKQEKPFGLGLTITKELIESMNGDIEFQSGEDGTSFTYYVECPIAKIPITGDGSSFSFEEEEEEGGKEEHEKGSSSKGGNKFLGKVLIVDDNNLLCKMLQSTLTQEYPNQIDLISTVSSGYEALSEIQRDLENPYSMIFMDINMQGMNGIECAKLIRGLENFSQPRIFAYTANQTFDLSLHVEFDGVVFKPFTEKSIKKVIDHQASEEASTQNSIEEERMRRKREKHIQYVTDMTKKYKPKYNTVSDQFSSRCTTLHLTMCLFQLGSVFLTIWIFPALAWVTLASVSLKLVLLNSWWKIRLGRFLQLSFDFVTAVLGTLFYKVTLLNKYLLAYQILNVHVYGYELKKVTRSPKWFWFWKTFVLLSYMATFILFQRRVDPLGQCDGFPELEYGAHSEWFCIAIWVIIILPLNVVETSYISWINMEENGIIQNDLKRVSVVVDDLKRQVRIVIGKITHDMRTPLAVLIQCCECLMDVAPDAEAFDLVQSVLCYACLLLSRIEVFNFESQIQYRHGNKESNAKRRGPFNAVEAIEEITYLVEGLTSSYVDEDYGSESEDEEKDTDTHDDNSNQFEMDIQVKIRDVDYCVSCPTSVEMLIQVILTELATDANYLFVQCFEDRKDGDTLDLCFKFESPRVKKLPLVDEPSGTLEDPISLKTLETLVSAISGRIEKKKNNTLLLRISASRIPKPKLVSSPSKGKKGSSIAGSGLKMVFIDDSALFLQLAKLAFQSPERNWKDGEDFKVFSAATAALEFISEFDGCIGAVVTDLNISPEMNGDILIKRLIDEGLYVKNGNKKVRKLYLLSADYRKDIPPIDGFLAKPLRKARFSNVMDEAEKLSTLL